MIRPLSTIDWGKRRNNYSNVTRWQNTNFSMPSVRREEQEIGSNRKEYNGVERYGAQQKGKRSKCMGSILWDTCKQGNSLGVAEVLSTRMG